MAENTLTKKSDLNRKKIAFFSPYVPNHFGGGEKHFFDVATVLAQKHEVAIGISHLHVSQISEIKSTYEKFLGYPLNNLSFITTPLGTSDFILWKLLWTQQFDYVYYVTDGSLFFSWAKHNNLHIQIPFTDKKSFFDTLKLKQWHTKNCNSFFTKFQIEKNWKTDITHVLHPMVDVNQLAMVGGKQKIILNVGRFFKTLHSKRQDVLISIFKSMILQYPELMKDYTLVLIGTVEDPQYLAELQAISAGLPIRFNTSCSRAELITQYQAANIYWHAAGFDVNEDSDPMLVEHFGISTVEAMAASCVPLVVGKGGQKEIMGEDLQWCLWQTEAECAEKTALVLQNPDQADNIRQLAQKRSSRYNKTVFSHAVESMFETAW